MIDELGYYHEDQEEEYINVGMIIRDYIRFLRRSWFLVILLLLAGIGGFYMLRESSYIQPSYNATVYYSVESVQDLETNVLIAGRLADSIPDITATKDFSLELSSALGVGKIASGYSFRASKTGSANLFNVTVSSVDSENVNQLLRAFEEVFPAWAQKVVGNCTLTIMDEAESSGNNYNEWSIKKVIVYGVAVAGLLWFMLATLRIVTVRKIHNQSEMYQVVDAECLGVIPKVRKKVRDKSKRDPLLITNKNIDDGYLQSIRTIRNQVEDWMKKDKKVFLVTSTVPHEGKSILTLNLAYDLVHRNMNVVVVEVDLYQMGASKILQVPSGTTGISEYLQDSEKKRITVFHRDGLSFIPAGNVTGDMTSLTNVRNMKNLIEKLKQTYDLVLIDTPPTNYRGETVILSEIADEVIYVIRADHAEIRDIRKGIKPFFQSQKLGGYIINGVTESAHGYGDDYGYGYSRYRYGYTKYHNYGYYGAEGKRRKKEKNVDSSDKNGTTRLEL